MGTILSWGEIHPSAQVLAQALCVTKFPLKSYFERFSGICEMHMAWMLPLRNGTISKHSCSIAVTSYICNMCLTSLLFWSSTMYVKSFASNWRPHWWVLSKFMVWASFIDSMVREHYLLEEEECIRHRMFTFAATCTVLPFVKCYCMLTWYR